MNPIQLQEPGGAAVHVWLCGQCYVPTADLRRAALCCTPVPCKYCSTPTERTYHAGYETAAHDECERRERARRDMERMERAEKLETWRGLVWHEGGGGDRGSGYFPDLDAYVDHLVCEGVKAEDWPEWVYVVTTHHPRVDAGHVLGDVLEGGWEEMDETDLEGVKELVDAISAFNRANLKVNVYHGDYRRAVRVPRPKNGR